MDDSDYDRYECDLSDRCHLHPSVIVHSSCGMYDAPCCLCEAEMYDDLEPGSLNRLGGWSVDVDCVIGPLPSMCGVVLGEWEDSDILF